ncbi:MAG: sugar kinase [Pseudomonadota bacterium]
MTDILCLGEPLVEFVRLENGTYKRGFGGDTSNAAIAAARQGASVGYLTKLGKDRFGDSIMALWAREGVDASLVTRASDAQTGIYFIDPDPEGRFFTYYRDGSAAARMTPNELPLDAIRSTKCFHLSGITLAVSEPLRQTAFTALHSAREAGATVSLDTNLRLKLWDIETARAQTHQAMALTDIAITSIEDSADLTGLTQPEQVADFYHELGARIILVTMGPEGCLLSENRVSTHVAPVPTIAVDSTGAGDSFAGAFLAWWLETDDPILAASRAARVAAGTVSGLGAVAPIPHRDAILAAE